MKILRVLVRFIICKLLFKVEYEGKENLDKNKRYVIVANHVSSMDAMLCMVNF